MSSINEEIVETIEDLENSLQEPGPITKNEAPLFARFLEKPLRVRTNVKAGLLNKACCNEKC